MPTKLSRDQHSTKLMESISKVYGSHFKGFLPEKLTFDKEGRIVWERLEHQDE